MHLPSILSRADESTLQSLLGAPVLRLLRLFDANLASNLQLCNLLINLRGAAGLLADPMSRAAIIHLLRPGEAKHLAMLLDIDKTDPFSALAALTVRRGTQREQALFGAFGLLPPTPEAAPNSPTLCHAAAALPLFEHQRVAARKVKAALASEPHRVLLHMPTGAGKTRTAMQIIADHLRANEPALVIWLAYNEELCEQAAAEFAQAWQYLGDRDLPIHRFWAGRDLDLAQAHDGLVVASLSKLYSAAMNSLPFISTLAGRCSLVIIDEAHRAVAETYTLMLNTLVTQGRRAALLGLTATPGRTWNDVTADSELAAFFGERKVMLEIAGYANPVDFLVDHGYLARANFRSLLHNSGVELSSADIRQIENELDIPSVILKRLAEDEQRNLAILVEIEKLALQHRRLLVFAASVEHATLLAAVLQARGFAAAAINGNTPPAERARLIATYKTHTEETRILCNYGVLTTGFDAPQTSAAVIARPTKSLVLYSQMVGRAMRGPKVGGNTHAEVVTVIDANLPGFDSVAHAFTNWEDVWRNL